MTAPRLLVEAPAVAPYQFGLASVAQPAPTDDLHWQNGVEYESISGYATSVGPGPCAANPTTVIPAGVATTKALPFSMYAGVDCSPVGYDEAYLIGRAQAILKLGWQQAAEKALWSGGGVTGLAPVLNASSTQSLGSAVAMPLAIGLLEDYLGHNYLGVGVIHAPRLASGVAARHRQTVERVGQLQTALGTQWCFGGGYDNTGPAGATPTANTAWLYATGLVTIRRAEPQVAGGLAAAFNRSTNGQRLYAEQMAVLTVDGPTVAVNVDLTK